MYPVDDSVSVKSITNIPQCSIGAPIPSVVSGEHRTAVLFYIEKEVAADWDGTSVRVVSADSEDEQVACVIFDFCYATMFGPPNDEVYDGHPLSEKGLGPYGVFEIIDSSWIRLLESLNSVHPRHDKENFMMNKHHYVLSFHDTNFECVARDYEVSLHSGSIKTVAAKIIDSVL